ncbi:class I SAM-dependent methyltransferase [Affinirhizobium pseudoryzae]|uniref:class I SAM-dependent methyltransferase n=1 Tax=Allorhizobium pseudoryzae TaxID=379684 RepID=UPI0013ED98B9|nr:class I SAM-dependent methyltransferase [Allorhizobium pseudoryzae]
MSTDSVNVDVFNLFMESYAQHVPEFLRKYLKDHRQRFLSTLRAIPAATEPGQRAIEIGTYGLFPVAMRTLLGYEEADGVVYEAQDGKVDQYLRRYPFDVEIHDYRIFDLNVEQTPLPVPDGSYDFILLAEVLEHFAIDPNFFMIEANRLLKPGGKLMITTPNACSLDHIARTLQFDVGSMFHFYRKNGSNDRHNLEYSPNLMRSMVENAGFSIARMWTENFWTGGWPSVEKLLISAGYSMDMRGDDLLVICEKVGPPGQRFPAFLYV